MNVWKLAEQYHINNQKTKILERWIITLPNFHEILTCAICINLVLLKMKLLQFSKLILPQQ